ncbi:acyltransferase 3 [Tricladium varicosporioides]|nr:acyltransferase 3 [Hymenoscyphus varicosporioides]
MCRSILEELIPSFAQPAKGAPSDSVHREGFKTAWLDGLRGVASLMVMIHHSSWLWYPNLLQGWGSCPECYHFVQLPIIRVFYMGSAMVAIFFVVSGFSLSHRALGLIRSGRFEDFLDALCSSTFRRGIRLLMPPIVLTFFMMLAANYGLYATSPGHRQPALYGSLSGNLNAWFHSVLSMSDIFRPVFYKGISYAVYVPPYDPNLWTIDVEFNGSLVIFLSLLGTSKLLPAFRLLVFIAINLWLLYFVHPYLFLFMSGVFLAELHHIREDCSSQQAQATELPTSLTLNRVIKEAIFERVPSNAWIAFWTVNFIFALYIISMPLVEHGARASPGYITLASWLPVQYRAAYVEDQFFIYLAAVHLIWIIDNAPFLQKIFTTRIAQYLAKISFALYLVHGTFLYTMGLRLSNWMHARTGTETPGQYTLGVLLTALCVYPPLLVTADFVWRHVDNKSVSFAKWLYVKMSLPKRATQSTHQYSELRGVPG